MNFSTNPYDHQQFGVPCKGKYKEILNTEWDKYNGNLKGHAPQGGARQCVLQDIISHI